MQSVLLKILLVLSPLGVKCWRTSGPTAPPSRKIPTALAPAPTKVPLRRAGSDPKGSASSPCARLSGDASVSDNVFYCSAGQVCNIGIGEIDRNYWGCCKEFVDDPCVHVCPFYDSCIDSTRLGSCDSDCMTNEQVLKCSESAKPFCAIGSAFMSDLLTESSVATLIQFACANYPYSLHYTIFEDNLYEFELCAPEWFTGRESKELDKSIESEITKFANPFDQLVTKANFSASTVLPFANSTTTAATVRIPTAPPATSTTTTSGGSKWVVSPWNGVYLLSLLFARWLLLS